MESGKSAKEFTSPVPFFHFLKHILLGIKEDIVQIARKATEIIFATDVSSCRVKYYQSLSSVPFYFWNTGAAVWFNAPPILEQDNVEKGEEKHREKGIGENQEISRNFRQSHFNA